MTDLSSRKRLSILILGLLAVISACVFLYLNYKQKEPAPATPAAIPEQVEDLLASRRHRLRFTDITQESGITFKHVNGAYGDRLLPETMGSGVAFFDVDNDNDQDLLFVNSMHWEGHETKSGNPPALTLYRNDGKGNFTDITQKAGLTGSSYGMGVSIGDIDNDGWQDIFITNVGENRLFKNNNGRFTDITANRQVLQVKAIAGVPAVPFSTWTMTAILTFTSPTIFTGRRRSISRSIFS